MRSLSHRAPVPAAVLVAGAFALGILADTAIRAPTQTTAVPVAPSPAEPLQPLDPPSAVATGYPADVLRVLDGDTFEARVQVWPGLEITTKVRLRGIDAPELKAHCADERIKAETARDALSALLAQGRVAIKDVRLDKYGGWVVADAATRDTISISEAMLARGHARRYDGGRRESWCGRPF